MSATGSLLRRRGLGALAILFGVLSLVLSGLVGTASANHSGPGTKDDCSTQHPNGNGNGANDPDGGDYENAPCDEDDFGENGNGGGNATGKPCAGCVGNADGKNPPGQANNGGDANSGYECDGRDRRPTNQNGKGNQGIGDGNPAHTPCVPGGSTETCPSGTTWNDKNNNQVIDPGECEPGRSSCPQGTTWTDRNNNGKVEPSECDSDDDDDDCVGSCGGSRRSSSTVTPEGEVLGETEETGEVQGVVLTSQETPPAGEVQGTELPRTGVSSAQLALVGLGLVLLGLGTTLVTRREPAVI